MRYAAPDITGRVLTMGMMLVILIGDIDISGGPLVRLHPLFALTLPAGNVRWFWPS